MNMVKESKSRIFRIRLNAIEYNWNIISKVVDRHERDTNQYIYYMYQK